MLTFRQVNTIVLNALRIIKGCELEIQETSGEVLYTVCVNADSGKLSLGKYRVWERHDGSGRSGWMPEDNITDPEVVRLRHAILNLITTDLLQTKEELSKSATKLPAPVDAAQGGEGDRETILSALQHYREIIETNQEETLSDKERQSPIYLLQKYIYTLGDGDWKRGAAKFDELQKANYEEKKKDDLALVKHLAMLESDNPTDRMYARFISEGGLGLRPKEAKELQQKILREENYKSASQPPAQVGAGKPKKKNKAWQDRAWAWRQISAKVRTRVLRRPIDCIREIQAKPGQREFKMSAKTMSRVIREGMAGDYDSP